MKKFEVRYREPNTVGDKGFDQEEMRSLLVCKRSRDGIDKSKVK